MVASSRRPKQSQFSEKWTITPFASRVAASIITDYPLRALPWTHPLRTVTNGWLNSIIDMIDKGALAPGMRLPSVRAVSEQHCISISTALQAYRVLEDRGVLVARPQSGFYVAAARRGAFALPSTSRPRTKASTVSISGAVAALLEHASNSALIPLGCAVPDAALLQSKRLDLALRAPHVKTARATTPIARRAASRACAARSQSARCAPGMRSRPTTCS